MSAIDLSIDPLKPSADWFNVLFETVGISAKVERLTAKAIGTGQIGENVRFEFTYAGEAGDAPSSLVGKFPSTNEASLATAKLLGHYQREVLFYREFAAIAARIAPAPLYAEHDKETNRFVLVMQDMAPAQQGDQLSGCSVDDAERAMEAAAILHTAHWNDARLDKHDWLQGTENAPPPPITPEMSQELWVGFKQRYADRLDAEDVEVGDTFCDALPKWSEGYEGPMALVHNDYRLDNMLFGDAGAAKPLAVVDWQTVGKGAPAIDVAYFIGAGLTRDARPDHERHLLAHYHKCLTREGVTSYSLDDLYRDYCWFSFYGMSVAFGAAMLVEQTERGDEMFLTMLRRHAAQARDNNALALLVK
ncbi:MAG: phosphotransferase family protein [Hyphomonas sp.]